MNCECRKLAPANRLRQTAILPRNRRPGVFFSDETSQPDSTGTFDPDPCARLIGRSRGAAVQTATRCAAAQAAFLRGIRRRRQESLDPGCHWRQRPHRPAGQSGAWQVRPAGPLPHARAEDPRFAHGEKSARGIAPPPLSPRLYVHHAQRSRPSHHLSDRRNYWLSQIQI